jgi:hypothetical protein
MLVVEKIVEQVVGVVVIDVAINHFDGFVYFS